MNNTDSDFDYILDVQERQVTEAEDRDFKFIRKCADASDYATWRRRQKRLEGMIEKLRPLNDKMIEIHAKRIPLLKDIDSLRDEMTSLCVHPRETLQHEGTHIVCKFCNRSLTINAQTED